jgi:hypothetical protein
MLKTGSEVTVAGGLFRGFRGVVREVSAEGVLVDLQMFGKATPARLAASDLVVEEDGDDSQSPFRVGDVVHVHDGVPRGLTATVRRVSPEHRQLVAVDGTQELPRSFDEVTLVSPLRGSPLPAYEAAARRAIDRRGDTLRKRGWWVERSRDRDWADEELPGLATRFLEFERRLDAERESVKDAAVVALHARLDPLPLDQQVARWIADHEQWTSWRSEMDEVRAGFTDEELDRGGELAGRVEEAGLLPFPPKMPAHLK